MKNFNFRIWLTLLSCFVLFFYQSLSFSRDKLIFSIDIVRHGDRTPLRALEGVPYPWKERVGQLTVNGMKNHLQIGKNFRARYVYNEKLLPENYDNDQIYVYSTDYDRTLMSAQAILMGLYPPGDSQLLEGYQLIPIHSNAKKDDIFLSNDTKEENFNTLLKKHVYNSKSWVAKKNETKNKWAEWSKAISWKINDLPDLIKIGNTLYIYRLYDVPIKELSGSDVENIINIYKWGMAEKYKPKEIGQLLGTEQVNYIKTYLNDRVTDKSNVKYVLVSAHDSTLLIIMSALGVPLNNAPNYGDYINFSAYEKEEGGHRVSISYNGELISIPKCKTDQCSLDEFIKL